MTENLDAEALRAAIVRRYGSVHRFCRRYKDKLNRATVYMILAGRYPGDVMRQTHRIMEALGLAKGQEEQAMEAIKLVACQRCSVTARPCGRCDELFRSQAVAVTQVFIS